MKSKKLLILVMNSDIYPSNTIVPFIKKTYLQKDNINLDIGQYEFPKFINDNFQATPYIFSRRFKQHIF